MRTFVKLVKIFALVMCSLAVNVVMSAPAMAEDTWSSSCSRKAAGDVLAYLEGTTAGCSADAGAQSFSVSTSAHSEGPNNYYYVPNCDYAGVNSACSAASAALTVKRDTDVLPSTQSITADLTNLAVSTRNSAGYGSGGNGYSEVKVTFYAYAYSCDWTWYDGWKCYTGKSSSTYVYLSCAPARTACNAYTTSMTLSVDVPYCNGYYCVNEWSVGSPYAKIVGTVTVQARSTTVGSIRSYASASGNVTIW